MKAQQIYQVANQILSNAHQKTLTHIGKMIGLLQSQKEAKAIDLIQISGEIKRNSQVDTNKTKRSQKSKNNKLNKRQFNYKFNIDGNIGTQIKNFQLQCQKLQWCGVGFTLQTIKLVQHHLRQLSIKQKTIQIRFWGIIRGSVADYYIIQARKQPYKTNQVFAVGAEKNGQGANYYSYYVINNLYESNWTQLPNIQPKHIKVARQIKRVFTGNLQNQIHSFPQFEGREKHYLKAQLCRITHSLQLSPKGIYKVHDQNPKIIEYQQQVKIPDFAQLNSLESWVHKNQMILNLGRCTHFVDPKTPEQQMEGKMAQLAEKDPEVERLKGINEDKIPQQLGLGVQNPWLLKLIGNPQIFTKEDANLVYAVISLKNIYWPGWITIGYKNGYSNLYIGNGLKSTQSSLSIYQNPDLQIQPNDSNEFGEPNPKQLPKEELPAQGQPKPQDQ